MKGERLFEIRLAVPEDRTCVAGMIHARCDWLEQRELPSLRRRVDLLAEQCGDGTVWVLTTGDGEVVGCTTVLDHGPARDWTEAERREPALYLFSTVTHPDYRSLKPGTVIAHWAVDRAARQERTWVRRGCLDPRLRDYYQAQGFHLVRDIPVRVGTLHVMARHAQKLDVPLPQEG
ncbi:GNAT family N-acetyltransferase [Nocardiopsis salina]|uniref:GNAT family N-acetyltransferase n=1 Tax=Nocardiopsis salina TaxID=245836 RepID=UPI000349DE41